MHNSVRGSLTVATPFITDFGEQMAQAQQRVSVCMLGVLVSAGAAIGLATSRCPQEWNVAQAIDAVTGTRL